MTTAHEPPTAACAGCEFDPGHVTPPCKHQLVLAAEEVDAIRARSLETAEWSVETAREAGGMSHERRWAALDEATIRLRELAREAVPRVLATIDARDAEIAKLRAWASEFRRDGKAAREALGAGEEELLVAEPARRVAAERDELAAENARLKARWAEEHPCGPALDALERAEAAIAKLEIHIGDARSAIADLVK